MLYDLSKENECYIFDKQVEFLRINEKLCDLTEKKKNRSTLQNAALHKYYDLISEQLNEMGITHEYKGITGKELETPFTPRLVKEFIWRPIQKALFDKVSTTEINTNEINAIIDVLSKFFGERGVHIPFPSINSLMGLKE